VQTIGEMHTALQDGDTASGDTFPQIALKLVEDAEFLIEKNHG